MVWVYNVHDEFNLRELRAVLHWDLISRESGITLEQARLPAPSSAGRLAGKLLGSNNFPGHARVDSLSLRWLHRGSEVVELGVEPLTFAWIATAGFRRQVT